MGQLPLKPANPERVCWGCDKYCPADDLAAATVRSGRRIRASGSAMTGSSGSLAPSNE
jgi:hypothetical protein